MPRAPQGRPERSERPAPAPDPNEPEADERAAAGAGRAPPEEVTRHWKGYELSPFQVSAIRAIQSGHNVLVSAPTGAGKTLVAEYAIVDAVRAGRRCIYTAPIKALSNQKYRDFRDDPEIDVGLMTGDVTIHPLAQVLIMTTEILRNAIFESPRSLHDVEYVIFDEVHYMDDPERGTVWEESLIFAPPTMRFICLSATISNLEEVGAWLEEIRPQPIEIVHSKRRPVPLHLRLYTARSGAFDLDQLERVRRTEHRPPARRARGRTGRRGRPAGGPPEGSAPPDAGPLFDRLQQHGLLPALVFSFSRKDCERLARANMHRELLEPEERRRMDELQAELVRIFQLGPSALDAEVFAMARRGVAYHHAGMLPVMKEVVERTFTSGLLKLLFTTETFALGINMPARTVVFQSLKKFDGISFDYMRTRDFLQMAGRAGRQGIDREGLVYMMLSERALQEAPVERIASGRPEPIDSRFRLSISTILHLVERLGRERVHEAWEKSFNRFQHRETSRKARDRNSSAQRRTIDSIIELLEELGYLRGDELRPRGRVAQCINGFELQVTELLFRGQLENLSPTALAVAFVGLTYEERRRGEPVHVPARLYGNLRRGIDRTIAELAGLAQRHSVPEAPKPASWGLSPAVVDWMEGRPFEELEPATEASPGDLCRAFRMAVQLMRQVRRAIDPDWDVHELLGQAMLRLNRDEVDARRQLELG